MVQQALHCQLNFLTLFQHSRTLTCSCIGNVLPGPFLIVCAWYHNWMAGRWGWGLGMKITCVWTRWQCHCLHLCEVLCANEIHNSNESYSLLRTYLQYIIHLLYVLHMHGVHSVHCILQHTDDFKSVTNNVIQAPAELLPSSAAMHPGLR